MPPTPKKIWLTRPAEDSRMLAEALERHRIESIIAPVKRIAPQNFNRPSRMPDALMITSRHAAYALSQFKPEWRELPIYCVGLGTAEYVKEQGCTNLIPGSRDVLALLTRISAGVPRGGHLVYFAGEQRRVEAASVLSPFEIEVETINVYRAINETSLPSELLDAFAQQAINAVSFFSPDTAETAIALLKRYSLERHAPTIDAFCLSQNIRKSTGSLPWKALHVCHNPTREDMIELIVSKLAKA